jgi:hypothetical protein
LCAAQIWFAGEKKHRDYLILHRPPKANAASRTEGMWSAHSLPPSATAGLELDLRRRDHAARLEKALAEVELT